MDKTSEIGSKLASLISSEAHNARGNVPKRPLSIRLDDTQAPLEQKLMTEASTATEIERPLTPVSPPPFVLHLGNTASYIVIGI